MNLQNSTKHLSLLLLLCHSSQLFAQSAAPASGLSVTRNPDGLLVTDNDRPVFQYQLTLKSQQHKWPRNNYIHPLYNLDGDIITEDFPDDHGHHRGVFWAWHQVFVDDVRLGDSWLCEDFQWDVQSSESSDSGPDAVKLSAHVHWKSPAFCHADGTPIPVVDEHTTLTVHSAQSGHRRIDFDIRLRALVPGVKIGGSEDEKGYGGFSPRIKLSPNQTFSSPVGDISPVKNSTMAGSWINIANEDWGMVILTHPANPGSPQPWILRRNRSMQNVVYPGPSTTPVSENTETRLRYSLIIHRGTHHDLKINELQTQYLQDTNGIRQPNDNGNTP